MLQRFASLSIRQSAAPSWLTAAMPHSTSPSLFLSTLTTSTSNNNTTTTTSPLFSPQNQLSIQTRSRSNRSQRGLYDGKDVSFGNNVPFSMKKTRRRWNPNVQYKRVYSEVLDEMVPFHITTSALRSIDKYGGLDEYLLKSRHVSTKGWVWYVCAVMLFKLPPFVVFGSVIFFYA